MTSVVALAVYVHFPWCLQKCPYCDFATRAIAPTDIPHDAYASAIVRELELRRPSFRVSAPLTLFFGGGTPSLWDPAAIQRIVAAVTASLGTPVEITVECNPNSLDPDRVAALAAAGVDRLSIGVQSLRRHHLRYLGRMHDEREALAALGAACARRSLRVSADLMFGMPHQTPDELVADAAELVATGVQHVSAYALTIEPTTRFGELARKGQLPRLGDEGVAVLFEVLRETLVSRGFRHYEVSNYAMAGQPSLHNLAYWRGAPYIGLGAAAVGCTGRNRYRNNPDAAEYTTALAAGRLSTGDSEDLDGETRAREALMLGLRTDEGVDVETVRAETGIELRTSRKLAIEKAVSRGNLEDDGHRLRIPAARWLHADGIVASLF